MVDCRSTYGSASPDIKVDWKHLLLGYKIGEEKFIDGHETVAISKFQAPKFHKFYYFQNFCFVQSAKNSDDDICMFTMSYAVL